MMDQVILVILTIICIRWPRDDPEPEIKLSAWYAEKMGWEPDDVLFNQTMVQLCHSPWGAMITQHDWEDWTKKNCRHDRAGEMNWNALCLILMSNLFWKVFPSLVPVLHVSMSGVLEARVRCQTPLYWRMARDDLQWGDNKILLQMSQLLCHVLSD